MCKDVVVLNRDEFEGIDELKSFFYNMEDIHEEFVN